MLDGLLRFCCQICFDWDLLSQLTLPYLIHGMGVCWGGERELRVLEKYHLFEVINIVQDIDL